MFFSVDNALHYIHFILLKTIQNTGGTLCELDGNEIIRIYKIKFKNQLILRQIDICSISPKCRQSSPLQAIPDVNSTFR